MSIVVVGSMFFDTIETPYGKAERLLGGSATEDLLLPDVDGRVSAHHPDVDSSEAAALLKSATLYRNTNASRFIRLNGDQIRVDDELLFLSLKHCRPADLFFQRATQQDCSEDVHALLEALLGLLGVALANITARPKSTMPARPDVSRQPSASACLEAGESYFPDHLLAGGQAEVADCSELDVVLLLEWVMRVASASVDRLHHFWPRLHGKSLLCVIAQ